MNDYPDAVVKPLLERLKSVLPKYMVDELHPGLGSEYQMNLQDLLWRAGKDGVTLPSDLASELEQLDPHFTVGNQGYYLRK